MITWKKTGHKSLKQLRFMQNHLVKERPTLRTLICFYFFSARSNEAAICTTASVPQATHSAQTQTEARGMRVRLRAWAYAYMFIKPNTQRWIQTNTSLARPNCRSTCLQHTSLQISPLNVYHLACPFQDSEGIGTHVQVRPVK